MEKKCPHCQKVFKTYNTKKVYCSDRCNNLAYISRRYSSDNSFNDRMRDCWQRYGIDKCPTCGNEKSKYDDECSVCRRYNIDDDMIGFMSNDDESLFNSPISLLKIDAMLFYDSNPDYTLEELLKKFDGYFDMKGDSESVRSENKKKVLKIIKSIFDGDDNGRFEE